MSQCLTQKEPVRYTSKLIKKTTGTNYTENTSAYTYRPVINHISHYIATARPRSVPGL